MCNCKEYQEIETGSILSSFQATTNCSHCSEQQYSKAHRHLEMNLAGPVFCSPNTSYPLYSPRPLCSVYPILRGIGIAHRISHLLFYLHLPTRLHPFPLLHGTSRSTNPPPRALKHVKPRAILPPTAVRKAFFFISWVPGGNAGEDSAFGMRHDR